MRSYLRIDGTKGGIKVRRMGTVNALTSWDGWIVIANPAEVLAHSDELVIEAIGTLRLTEASFTKVMSGADAKIRYEMEGENMEIVLKPLLLYDGASCNVNLRIKSSNFHLDETVVLGRTHHGERFRRGKLKSLTEVRDRNGKLIVYDPLEIEGERWMNPNFMGSNTIRTLITVREGEPSVIRMIGEHALVRSY